MGHPHPEPWSDTDHGPQGPDESPKTQNPAPHHQGEILPGDPYDRARKEGVTKVTVILIGISLVVVVVWIIVSSLSAALSGDGGDQASAAADAVVMLSSTPYQF